MISHILHLQEEGETYLPHFYPFSTKPALAQALYFPLKTGPLTGCPSPVIPVDAKAWLHSVFLELREVPKATSSHLFVL